VALVGVGEVPLAQVVGELGRAEGGRWGWHDGLLRSASRAGTAPSPVVRLKVAG
jgi:hypothetical protein